jgi:isopenicillin-N N-acyltransferase like protein
MGRKGRLKRIVISGDPWSRGNQYGTKAKKQIEKGIGNYRLDFLKSSGVTWEKAIRFSKTFVKRVRDYDAGMVDEIQGIAKGSGRTVDEILILNLRTEILQGLMQTGEGCTSLCALPEVTRGERTLLAQNWDYKPWVGETMVLLQIHQEKAPDILTLVEAGQLARMGMNSAGHGICNNYVLSEIDGRDMGKGIPTTFIRRKALGQEKYYDVIGTVIHTPRSFSANYLVATSEGDGDSINIEATPDRAYFLFPEEGLLTHSNHFKGAGPGYVGRLWNGLENSLYRDRRALKLLCRKSGKIGVKEIMRTLKDHFGFPRSICRHPDEKEAGKDRWRTNASVIMDLGARVLWLAEGPPCQHDYQRFTFGREE